MKVSICIPTYYANGAGPRVLKRLFKSIKEQSFTDYEVIVSDHSTIDQQDIYNLCVDEGRDLDLVYTDCQIGLGNSAINTNNAINHATGDLIKVMNHDDFFYHPDALKLMVERIGNKGWLACGCIHTDEGETRLERLHHPRWTNEKNFVELINTIGCPTVSLFKNTDDIRFDSNRETLYAIDCDLYIQLQRKYGLPAILEDPGVVIRMWDSQLTNQMNIEIEAERSKKYLRAKYGYT